MDSKYSNDLENSQKSHSITFWWILLHMPRTKFTQNMWSNKTMIVVPSQRKFNFLFERKLTKPFIMPFSYVHCINKIIIVINNVYTSHRQQTFNLNPIHFQVNLSCIIHCSGSSDAHSCRKNSLHVCYVSVTTSGDSQSPEEGTHWKWNEENHTIFGHVAR